MKHLFDPLTGLCESCGLNLNICTEASEATWLRGTTCPLSKEEAVFLLANMAWQQLPQFTDGKYHLGLRIWKS